MQQQPQQQQHSQGERPYRSHLRPACLPCRRRKSRCQTEAEASICLMCRAHGTDCIYPGDTRAQDQPQRRSAPSNKRRRASPSQEKTAEPEPDPMYRSSVPAQGPSLHRTPLPSFPSPMASNTGQGLAGHSFGTDSNVYDEDMFNSAADDQAQNLHIVGPAVTKDSQVLSDYLSAIPGATRATRMVIPIPANRSRPVLFTRVQKRPLGVSVNRSPSAEKLEMIEKLLGPEAPHVIDVYFRKVNACFPLLDEVLFRRQYQTDKHRISPALIASIYAHTIVHWRTTEPLRSRREPDHRFIWNLSNDAVYSELHLSPGMSIIKAIILNIGGLPTTSLIGNGVLLGSAVSMVHSLGLNHNPLPWEIPHVEKCLRMKIWWALLLHDRWASLAHGTPPHISRIQYDVPNPTMEYICQDTSQEQHRRPAAIFIALLSLTDVLDKHLQFIYNVNKDGNTSTTDLELALNSWVESLSGIKRLIILRGSNLDVPGAPNFRLSYLTVRLLLQRIQLEADKHMYEPHDQRLANRYIQARRTAEEILLLTQELTPSQLGDCWLSTHAFSYPAAVNFLLRCGLETENSPAELVQSASFRIAHDIITTLRKHQEQYSWELADVCLAQHAEIVDKILASVSQEPQQDQAGGGDFEPSEFVMPDASMIDSLFPSLWDPLQNVW